MKFMCHQIMEKLKGHHNSQSFPRPCEARPFLQVNNLKGQMKSKLLFCIGELDRRFRDMVLLVKEWAKAQDMNNPRSGSFNSYICPHFACGLPLSGLRADAEKRIEETCVASITRLKSEKFGAENTSSLSQLFISFLEKFSDIVLKTRKLGICTYTGQWEDIESNMTWLPHTYAIMIEDPFDPPENSSRAVSMGELTRISEAFKMSKHILMSANRSDILATLLRSLTYCLVTGTSLNQFQHRTAAYAQRFKTELPHSRAPRGNSVPKQQRRPQVHKWAQKPSRVQPQFQKMEPGNHPDKSTFQEMKPENHANKFTPDNTTLETSQDCACRMCMPGEYIQ